MRHQQSGGKPVPTPGPDLNSNAGTLIASALTDFGMACHTYMDSVSPAHHGWQKYAMPKIKLTIVEPQSGVVMNEVEEWDLLKYYREGIQHAAEESAPPTDEQRNDATLYMLGAFLTTFTNKWFKKAVKSESERQKTYDFVKGLGFSIEEDFGIMEVPQIKIPKENMQKI